jgi:hypothetical protein
MTPPPRFFEKYTALVTEADLPSALVAQGRDFEALIRSVPESESTVLHAPYTWTIKQVVHHVIDSERVFGYRALRFARGDTTSLPGFDEHLFASKADSNSRDLKDLTDEFVSLRTSHVHLFRSMPQAVWSNTGPAANLQWSVTDLCKAIIGHARHHERIIRSRIGS